MLSDLQTACLIDSHESFHVLFSGRTDSTALINPFPHHQLAGCVVVHGSGAAVTKTVSVAEITKRRSKARPLTTNIDSITLPVLQGLHQNTQIYYTTCVSSAHGLFS